jgi:hypothetical protein
VQTAGAFDMSCSLVYLDIGSNVGDSLQLFANKRPEARLKETLRVAVGSWSPLTTCVYGFEPNPSWTARLRHLQQRLAPRLANLTIYTETAIGGPEQVAHPMWLVHDSSSANSVGSHLTSDRPSSRRAQPVTTLRLSSWLRDVCAVRHGRQTPVVMRMDIEGIEYDTLTDLAVSGIGQSMELYLTLEWHRNRKPAILGVRELAFMQMLDERFLRYPYRCSDGSCTGDNGALSVRAENGTLEGGLEKVLAFMLHRAGITYVDAFFDVKNRRKEPSAQSWESTRQRRNHVGFNSYTNSSSTTSSLLTSSRSDVTSPE